VHHSFSNLERILTLVIKKEKELKLVKFIFTTHLNTFGSNTFLALKIMNYEYVVLTKVIHLCVVKNMNSYYS
jgi:hypothetical protein